LNTIKTPEDLANAEHEIEVEVSKNGWTVKLQLRFKKLKALKNKLQNLLTEV